MLRSLYGSIGCERIETIELSGGIMLQAAGLTDDPLLHVFGEVSLSGALRPAPQTEARRREANEQVFARLKARYRIQVDDEAILRATSTQTARLTR